MKFPSKEMLEHYRAMYPVGTRVELLAMRDPQAPPVGTRGTVLWVDDAADLVMRWDNGSGLNVCLDEDSVRIMKE